MTSDLLRFYEGKRLLVTGGAGYLATNLVRLLEGSKCNIIRLDRRGATFAQARGSVIVEDVTGDVRDRAVWERVLTGTDVIFHFAAQTSVYVAEQDPPADLEVNVVPMLHILETCREKGWQPAVLFSGTATESGIPTRLPVDETHSDNPVTVYDLHKLLTESYLKHYVRRGVVCGVTLRLANVYGPGPKSGSADRGVLNMMVRRALAGEALTVYGRGDFLRDYVYVEDIVRAFLEAGRGGEQVNGLHFVIGTGQGHTVAEALNLVADRVARRTGKRVEVNHVEPPGPLSPIEFRNFVADSRRFTKATGWQASISLLEGIDRTIAAFA